MAQDTDVSHIATPCTVKDEPYVILKWSVENFSYARNSLKSPCFDLGPTSKWNFVLEPRCDPGPGDDGEECVKIFLRRNSECSSSTDIMINGEFTVQGPENNFIFERTFSNVVMSENDELDFRIPRMLFHLSESQPSPTSASLQSPTSSLQSFDEPAGLYEDAYLFRCEMVLTWETTMNVASEAACHLEALSRDMANLLIHTRFSDVNIRAINGYVCVHKAILHARSETLSDILKVSNFIDATEEIWDHVNAVLVFVYTGDPDYTLFNLEVEAFWQIAQIAKQWELNELENILTPFTVMWVTRIRCERFLYTWRINNAIEQLFTTKHTSSEFVTNHQQGNQRVIKSARWKLSLYISEDDLILCLLKADDESSNVSCRTDLEFRLFNDKSNVDVKQSGQHTFEHRISSQGCMIVTMCKATYARNQIMKDDTLNVECKMTFQLDPEESCIQKTATCVDLTEPEDSHSLKYLKSLSHDLKKLYESKAYADLEVRSNNKTYAVHKGILWARSQFFSKLLSRTSPEYISLPIDDDIMNDILPYIYSAELPRLSLLNVQRLYEESFLLQLQELHLACRSYILQNIRIDNVLEFAILAHKCKDKHLELAAEKFSCVPANVKVIITTELWQKFRGEYPDFAMRVYHKLCTILLGL